jgi:hypothetical protein
MAKESGPSERTTLKRGSDRAVYDDEHIRQILAAGTIAHVGVATHDGPIVLPMVYGVDGDRILLHGGIANAMLRSGRSTEVCVTITIVDALVVARSPLHNSMNYRSVVIRGEATVLHPDDKPAALKIINDHIAPIWDTARPPSEVDLRQTTVVSVPLTEASAKVRAGDPVDDPSDLDGPHWSGLVPLHTTWGEPRPAADLSEQVTVPLGVSTLAGAPAHPPTPH